MPLNRTTPEGYPIMFIQGNDACVYGAIHAGCRFFAGYPITPSTEIAEGMARELPKVGGVFIQMEDEIASIAAIIGASAAGMVSMTATSGPGFSLMQENIGYAYMVQLPVVVVDVQRGGPSTGLPTMLSQSDTMQAQWGTHGDYTAIAIAPSSVQETYDMIIRAFELAERFSTPVAFLLDELIGHMREKVVLNRVNNPVPVSRHEPKVPPEWYLPYKPDDEFICHLAPFGRGFRYSITGLTHDRAGFPTSVPSRIADCLDNMRQKIMKHREEIWDWKEYYIDGARCVVVAYGSAARAARGAIETLKVQNVPTGLMELKTIWPFPYEPLAQIVERSGASVVIVAENNMGQMIHMVREALPHDIKVLGCNRYDGHPLEPDQIVEAVKEAL